MGFGSSFLTAFLGGRALFEFLDNREEAKAYQKEVEQRENRRDKVLSSLNSTPQTIQELSHKTGMEIPEITGVINGMRGRGLVKEIKMEDSKGCLRNHFFI